jgi:hypothetical protein
VWRSLSISARFLWCLSRPRPSITPFGVHSAAFKKEKVKVLREWRGGRVIPDTGKSRIPVPIYYLKS